MSQKTTNSGGIGFFGLLTIVFIVLKLCKVITWSWWWVIAPTLIPFSIVSVILIIAGIVWVASKAMLAK